MFNRHLQQLLLLALVIAPAMQVQAQARAAEPPRKLEGVWELVSLNGRELPLQLERDGGDPAECDGHGEYIGQRTGEGRLVVRTAEMWMGSRSERWEGGIFGYFPEEIVCRGPGDVAVVLRRDQHNRARPTADVEPIWRGHGSYGVLDSTATLTVSDYEWTVADRTAARGALLLRDVEGNTWVFRRATPGPRFETPGFFTALGDFDGDGERDQVRVSPGRHDVGTMMASLAAGPVTRVTDVTAGAHVVLAPRGRTWRNADGGTLQITDRDAVLVSVEPAAERSDVTVYYMRNGNWVAWEYAPD